MSTLQHTIQPSLRNRLALVVVAVAAAAAVTIALILSAGGGSSPSASSSSAHPTRAQLERQLEAVAGARYPTTRP